MDTRELERIETDLLLEALYKRYGFDFRSYARASIDRRVSRLLKEERIATVSELIPLLIHDEAMLSRIVQQFSVNVSEMFRDPQVFAALRRQVLPVLHSYPFVKAWVAGCANGEEAYSLAILLAETDLLDRCTIYGTDFNDAVLQHARQGIYPLDRLQSYTGNYQKSGGQKSFSAYYSADSNSAVLQQGLKQKLLFANHNLVSDGVFGEMQMVFCRNVLIYFNRQLQDRVLGLFRESLVHGGFLILGTKEDIRFSSVASDFECVNRKARIFRKRG